MEERVTYRIDWPRLLVEAVKESACGRRGGGVGSGMTGAGRLKNKFGDLRRFDMRALGYVLLGSLAVALLTGLGVGAAGPKAPAQPKAAPTSDQQVAELVEAYLALPATAKLEAEGDRILERLRRVRGKLSPRSKEAVARLEASQTLRGLAQALQKNDQQSLKNLVSKQREREVLAERLTEALPYIEPSPRKWEYKILAESYVEKLGEGELVAGLGQLGEEGWELVGFKKDRLVFKRLK
jgi:hypothetical protein